MILKKIEEKTVATQHTTQTVLCKKENCKTVGTQHKPQVESKGTQCSLESLYGEKYKCTGTQCDFYQYVSKATQCSFSDCNHIHTPLCMKCMTCHGMKTSNDTVTNHSQQAGFVQEDIVTAQSKYRVFHRRKDIEGKQQCNCGSFPTSTPQSGSKSAFQKCSKCTKNCYCETSEPFLEKHCSGSRTVAQQSSLKTFGGEVLLDHIILGIKERTSGPKEGMLSCKAIEPCPSCPTSGVGEMSDSRSAFSELMEHPTRTVALGKKAEKRKKKLLWTPSHDTVSVSDCDEPVDIPCLIPAKQTHLSQKESESNNTVLSFLCRRIYTREEQLLIIKYIVENNLYSRVGGVNIWQDMAAEVGINRTWQSLKEHFRKQILPNIKKYKLSSTVEKSFCNVNMK